MPSPTYLQVNDARKFVIEIRPRPTFAPFFDEELSQNQTAVVNSKVEYKLPEYTRYQFPDEGKNSVFVSLLDPTVKKQKESFIQGMLSFAKESGTLTIAPRLFIKLSDEEEDIRVKKEKMLKSHAIEVILTEEYTGLNTVYEFAFTVLDQESWPTREEIILESGDEELIEELVEEKEEEVKEEEVVEPVEEPSVDSPQNAKAA